MEKLDLSKEGLKKFGIIMCVAFLVITGLISFRHGGIYTPTATTAGLFLVLGLIQPTLLKPVYIIWMRLAFILAWINTRLILFIMFYLIFTPVGIFMRLLRIDLLDRKVDKSKKSYWLKKEKGVFTSLNYERQF